MGNKGIQSLYDKIPFSFLGPVEVKLPFSTVQGSGSLGGFGSLGEYCFVLIGKLQCVV